MFFIWKGENDSEKLTLKHLFSKQKMKKAKYVTVGVKRFTFLHLGKKESPSEVWSRSSDNQSWATLVKKKTKMTQTTKTLKAL